MFAKISLVIAWLPRIVAVAMLVEELLDEEATGSDKKETALRFLARQGLPERYVAVIGSVIDLVVDVMHAVGVFKRGAEEDIDVIVPPVLLKEPVRKAVDDAEFEDAYKALFPK